MEMKQYLIDTFMFNDQANKKILEKIKILPEKEMSIKFFSHLINSQKYWLARINMYPAAPQMDWWEPLYDLNDLENEWGKSLESWLEYLEGKTDEQIFEVRKFIGYDGSTFSAPLKDIALQLNYHSIHHRAQIQTLIRQQGLKPDFIDYIGTIYKRNRE